MPSPASRESAARRPVVPLKAGPVRNFSRLGPCARGQVRVSQQGKRTARGVWPSGKRTRGSNRPLLEPDPTGLPAGSALIVVERGPNAGSRFLLDQPVTSVGRHPRSDIFLDDVTVSRRHVELRWEKDDFHVTSPGHSAANSVSAATAATKPPRRSRRYPSTDSGTIAEMDARSGPGLNDPFEEAIDDALSSLPADLRAAMSNVEIVVEDEPPDGQPLLGLYRGVPLPRRSSTYSGVLPDKISIFGGPITRLAAGDADRLRREVRHVVLHEIAHHFGISDERLIELDRY